MNPPKPAVVVLILVLVAIVALFIVGLAVRDGSLRVPSARERQALRERWFGKSDTDGGEAGEDEANKVRASEVRGDCRLVPQGQTCEVSILEASKLSRTLPVSVTGGVSVVLKPRSSDSKIPMNLKLAPNRKKSVQLSIDRSGAVLELTCVEGPSVDPLRRCVIALGVE